MSQNLARWERDDKKDNNPSERRSGRLPQAWAGGGLYWAVWTCGFIKEDRQDLVGFGYQGEERGLSLSNLKRW